MRALLARAYGLFRKDPGGVLDEEIQEHAAMLAADYVRRGMAEDEARFAALRDMGNVTAMRQEYRERSGIPAIENFWRDLKYAFRTLRRNPAFTSSCVVTLTVGLGAMITVLCVVSAFLWKPLPYPAPERLIALRETDPRNGLWTFSEPTLIDVRERSRSLGEVAAYRRDTVALTGAGEPEVLPAAAVTPSLFKMFGIGPVAGTRFRDSPREVVVSPALWKRKWNRDPHVIGQGISLNGEIYTVVGVAQPPADLLPSVELLFPLLPNAAESRTAHDIDVVGRMRTGVNAAQAQAELSAIAGSIARENAQTNAGWGIRAMPLAGFLAGPNTGRTIWMIFAAVALLWILACANVAGLQMARNIARRHEIATRLALGASRGRLMAQSLTESAVLAFGGGIFGMVLAGCAIAAIRRLAGGSLPKIASLSMDPAAILAAAACLLVSTLLFGVSWGRPPALQQGREVSRRDGGRDILVMVQVAMASILLLGAGLLSQSFLRLRAVDPGFDPEKVLNVRVSLSERGENDSRKTAFFREVEDRLARLPDVKSAGATNVVPFIGYGTANRFQVEGEPASAEYRSAAWRAVTPGFFTTLGIPLKRGRLFTERDANGSLEVVILSESMAKRFWPNQDPIGRRLLWGRSASPKTIVGVVGDIRDVAVDAAPEPTMFRPFAQLSDAPMTLVIRTRGEPEAAIADVRRAIWAIDGNAALEFQPLRQAMADSILRPRASLMAVAAFSILALITAAFGLYGLISYRVNQRRQEIGIRLALGAQAGWIHWDVQKRCLMLVGAGAAIGLPLAYALSSLMTSLLYETQPSETGAYVVVLAVFLAVGFAASFGPARRASRMDPASAIRHE